MANKITKANLIAEIAQNSKLKKSQVARVLDNLTQISYREAVNGFIVPGICKLTVVRRKERRCRIPSTGQLVLIGERDALKITPIGASKNAIAPRDMRSITVIDENQKIPDEKSSQNKNTDKTSPEEEISSEENATTGLDEGSIVFGCHECGSMISAPTSSAGKSAECPFCNIEVKIPLKEESTTTTEQTTNDSNDTTSHTSEGFMTFFCNECGQEIESAKSMAGLTASCPTCGSHIDIPDSSMPPALDTSSDHDESTESPSMTMRIDLLDL